MRTVGLVVYVVVLSDGFYARFVGFCFDGVDFQIYIVLCDWFSVFVDVYWVVCKIVTVD